mmetsp:Transcript_6404/g.16700  ORF Transcript_6404/g.16700 Transcript_6404/m.16700 type:complete len:231 (-) Transcript_6404:30-722(-)
MVLSLRLSTRTSSSHGRRDPSPKFRLQAHCFIHPSVYSNELRASEWYVSMLASSFSVTSLHFSSPYVMYHWSVSATMHSSPLRLITFFSGSEYRMPSPSAIISPLMIGLASLTFLPLCAPTSMTPSVNPFRYVRSLAMASLSLSFALLILSSSHTLIADVSPNSGMLMIGITSNDMIISSLIPYFSRNAGFSLRSRSEQKSSGESEGTLVTMPVPLSMEIESMGSVYTFS